MPKFLIIRFSSIGDIVQCMGIINGIREHFPEAEIHWIARQDMAEILSIDNRINKIWAFDKEKGFGGLLKVASQLRSEHYDYIYDAHSNIRSNILKFYLSPIPGCKPYITLRYKDRWKRFMLFKWGVNQFDMPFRGVESYRKPLKKWGISKFPDDQNNWSFPENIISKWEKFIDPKTIILAPSANWGMKRWPISHWQQLIMLLPNLRFIILGGPEDTFCEEIKTIAPERTVNLSGKTSLLESSYLIHEANIVVSGDTGLMHLADLFRIPTIALIGPTAFGFPTGPTAEVFEVDLQCRPCSKDGQGKCKQIIYQKCMFDITPQRVEKRIIQLLSDTN